MNIIAIRLVLVETKTGSIVMCKILMVVVAFFECAHVILILLSLAATHYCSSWLLLETLSQNGYRQRWNFLVVQELLTIQYSLFMVNLYIALLTGVSQWTSFLRWCWSNKMKSYNCTVYTNDVPTKTHV